MSLIRASSLETLRDQVVSALMTLTTGDRRRFEDSLPAAAEAGLLPLFQGTQTKTVDLIRTLKNWPGTPGQLSLLLQTVSTLRDLASGKPTLANAREKREEILASVMAGVTDLLPSQAETFALRFLACPDAETRVIAVEAVVEQMGTSAAELLHRAGTDDSDAGVRAAAIRGLTAIKATTSLEIIARDHSDEEARARAVRGLAACGAAAAVCSIVTEPESPAVIDAAIEAIRTFTDPEAVPHLLGLLDLESTSVVRASTVALLQTGDARGLWALATRLRSTGDTAANEGVAKGLLDFSQRSTERPLEIGSGAQDGAAALAAAIAKLDWSEEFEGEIRSLQLLLTEAVDRAEACRVALRLIGDGSIEHGERERFLPILRRTAGADDLDAMIEFRESEEEQAAGEWEHVWYDHHPRWEPDRNSESFRFCESLRKTIREVEARLAKSQTP